MTASDFKDLAPFLAVVVSMLALTIGPFISGRVARAQAIASMREKWIYAFRDCLVELITEFDVLHEFVGEEGLMASDDYQERIATLRALANRASLMVNTDEEVYKQLMRGIEGLISHLLEGIKDYEEFHDLNAQVTTLAQAAIRSEWKKISP
jgi:hypothetical protein